MTPPPSAIIQHLRLQSSLAHLSNALDGAVDDANVRAEQEVDRLLSEIRETAAA